MIEAVNHLYYLSSVSCMFIVNPEVKCDHRKTLHFLLAKGKMKILY